MVLKKLHLSNIILTICSLVYFWILIKIILLKNGFINYCNIIFANFITSLSFELIQLSTGWGIFDVDDIFLNTLGGIIGIIIYHLITKNKHSKIPSTIFLINFGIIGYISLYKFYPILLPSFII